MQHSKGAVRSLMHTEQGAHSLKSGSSQASRSHYKGSHSHGRMVRGVKSTLVMGIAAVMLAVAATPVLVYAATPRMATALESNITGFANPVNSDTIEMPSTTAAKLLDSSDFYLTQSQQGRCTVASAAMMLRRAAFLNDEDWQAIDETSLVPFAWTSGGLKNNFKAFGMSVAFHGFDGGRADSIQLQNLLLAHPEGVVVYDSALPHAIVLTDYNKDTKTFYCADPAGVYSGKRIKLESSWNGANRCGQDGVISSLTSYWVIED